MSDQSTAGEKRARPRADRLSDSTEKPASTRDPRFEIKDHVPEAVDLTALDHLQRLQPAKCLVRRFEPLRNLVPRNHLGKALLEALRLANTTQGRLVGLVAALPVGDRALRIASQTREYLPGHAQ